VTTREEWLEQRKKFITASDVAALLSESPYKTPEHLRMEKLGLADDFAGDESTDLALGLEPWVLEQANKKFGWRTRHNTELVLDKVCSRLAATPDATMETPYGLAVVQVKVTRSAAQEDCRAVTKGGKPSSAAFLTGAPLHYQLQVLTEMMCTGTRLGCVLALHTTPLKLRAYPVQYNELAAARIRRETIRFWAEIEAFKKGLAI
jgi:predicted phage-related endonuclease